MKARPTPAAPGRLLRSRAVATAVVVAWSVVGLSASPAAGDPSRGTGLACPNETPDAFTDDEASVHETSIDCMARWNVAGGTSPGTYRPELTVRRDQTASFVARLMSTAGFALDGDPDDQFDDDDGSVHEKAVNQLAVAGVVRGSGDRTYSPSETLNRGQMAALLNRAVEALGHGAGAAHEHFTDDDDSVFERDIDRLASLGVVEGTGGQLYSPARSVHRGAMAAFLGRTADHLADRGSWPTATGPVKSPSEFRAEQTGESQVLLSWTPPEDIRVDFYFLQIALSPPDLTCERVRFNGFAEMLEGRSTDGYLHTGQRGATYCYRLRAVDSNGRFQTDAPAVFAGPVTIR